MADQKRPKISETAVVRWFCYAGFAVCSVLLVAALAVGWDWWAPLVGTVVYGIPALTMYQGEQARRENLAVVAGAQATRAGASPGSFEFSTDDPTQPPTRKALEH